MPKRTHNWEAIDPNIFTGKVSMAQLARDYHVSYRQVTNRKYQLRDRVQLLHKNKKTTELKKMLKYLGVKKIDQIPFLTQASRE